MFGWDLDEKKSKTPFDDALEDFETNANNINLGVDKSKGKSEKLWDMDDY